MTVKLLYSISVASPLLVLLASTVFASSISSFIVYYGPLTNASLLESYSLAILSPLNDADVIRNLSVMGVTPVGYVSLSTVGGWEPWASKVSSDMIVAESKTWGEKVVNISDPRWKQILLEDAIPFLLSKGFKGVFFDNLDQVDVYPWMADSLVDIIREARQRYPELVIVVNRGFTIADRIAPYIDAVLFECFGTYYDFSTGKYRKFTGSDLQWIKLQAEKLKALSEEYGFTVLALGYADPENATQWEEYSNYVHQLASQYGFPVFMSNIHLTYLPSKPPEEAPEKPGEAQPSAPGAEAQSMPPLLIPVIGAALAAVAAAALLIARRSWS